MSERTGTPVVYRMSWSGGAQTRLTNDPGEDVYPDWSPAGTKIVWATNRSADFDLWVMARSGANPVARAPRTRTWTSVPRLLAGRRFDYCTRLDSTGCYQCSCGAGRPAARPLASPRATRTSTARPTRTVAVHDQRYRAADALLAARQATTSFVAWVATTRSPAMVATTSCSGVGDYFSTAGWGRCAQRWPRFRPAAWRRRQRPCAGARRRRGEAVDGGLWLRHLPRRQR